MTHFGDLRENKRRLLQDRPDEVKHVWDAEAVVRGCVLLITAMEGVVRHPRSMVTW